MECHFCSESIRGAYREWPDGERCCEACQASAAACVRCAKPGQGEPALCTGCASEVAACVACESPLLGRYLRVPSLGDLCEPCHERLPRCVRCQAPVIEGESEGGRVFCATCHAEGDRCSLCDDIITGKYWSHDRAEKICTRCHETLPKCARCGIPAEAPRPVAPDAAEVLCTVCWGEAPRCHACDLALTGQYFSVESAPDRKFCPGCSAAAERCDFCGIPLGDLSKPESKNKTFTYPDGRLSCADCRATAVVDITTLRRLQAQSRRWLKDRLGLSLRSAADCPILLVDANTLAAYQKKRFSATAGFDPRERGLFSAQIKTTLRDGEEIARDETLLIQVELGLPLDEALGTMVHELTHLWQLDHFPPGVSLRLVEGLACWTQYHLLRDNGMDRAAERVAQNPDPIYGDGFRDVRAIEAQHGFAQTIPRLLIQLRG